MDDQLSFHIEQLKSLKTRDYWQKYCASEDWFEADFKYALKHIIKQNASFRRKQWEVTTIFLNLFNYGMLDGTKVGAAFGAGKEQLIFRILPLTAGFHATDLYALNTGWSSAKLGQQQSPYEFVAAAAPPNCDLSPLQVHEMNMCDLSHFADQSLDFCYSSCAFEHIGHREDFINHLQEVRRVLKPGGIYSMTTEFLFDEPTKPIKGNYKFDIEYLRELFIESGLSTADHFQGECEPNLINWPKPPVDSMAVNDLANLYNSPILCTEGIPFATCNFVLQPASTEPPKSFSVSGLEKAGAMFRHRASVNVRRILSDWQPINPFNRLRLEVRNYMLDHQEYLVASGFELNLEENLVRGVMVHTDFIDFNDHGGAFKIQYDLTGYNGNISWQVIEKGPMEVKSRRVLMTHKSSNHQNNHIKLEFKTSDKKVYALSAQITSGSKNANIMIKSMLVWAKAKVR